MKSFREYVAESVDFNSTLAFIKKAHGSQKYGNKPYWTHPLAVCETGKRIFGSAFNSEAQQAALLHDVVEDTKYTIEDLKSMGYSDAVTTAVSLLTKDKSLSYEDNIKKIVNSGSKIAQMVKYSDNYENFHGDKSSWPADKAAKSQAKYAKSMDVLGNKLGLSNLKEETKSPHENYARSQEKKHDEMANHHIKMHTATIKTKNKDLDLGVPVKNLNANRDIAAKAHIDAANAHRNAARHYGAYADGDYTGINKKYIDILPRKSSKDARVASDEAHKVSKKHDNSFYEKHAPKYKNGYQEI
jgi:hypothetical protein